MQRLLLLANFLISLGGGGSPPSIDYETSWISDRVRKCATADVKGHTAWLGTVARASRTEWTSQLMP